MACPKCSSRHVTQIVINLAPGQQHVFASCHGCEWKAWFKEGSTVPLASVLTLAAERRF